MRKQFIIGSLILILFFIAMAFVLPKTFMPIHYTLSVILGVIILIGFKDAFQQKQTIKRNFPVIGRFRYLLESIRPEIQQYFIETNTEGMPFSREQRSVVYQRSKGALDTLPFGTQKDVYAAGYEWVKHSIKTEHVEAKTLRVLVGGKDCKKPYSASIFNISAMSFGALSENAILALNGGAKDGSFAHNTGEGSISKYHEGPGGDLIWQIGTGYFGCRDEGGNFDPELFAKKAKKDQVKMIEIKLSQGAKPGHGGILPKEKITPEIARIRNVPMGRDIVSPSSHKAFSTPVGLLEFIQQLRDLSGGKPIGFKLCIGKRREFLAICKAMLKTGISPDFITIDGGEGGTGAAPIEFSNNIGEPSVDGLIFVHNSLNGFGLRDDIKLISASKITTGFGIIKQIALGADLTYSARAMMLALGCIQALRCNANICPAGVATQDKNLMAGLVVGDKRKRVHTFHKQTLESVAHMMGAMGLCKTNELRPYHVVTRLGAVENKTYGELFEFVRKRAFLKGEIPKDLVGPFNKATPDSFDSLARVEKQISA